MPERVHAGIVLYTCGRCSRPVETLEKVSVGDWRCLDCAQIKHLNWRTMEPIVPTALQLAEEYRW